MYLTKNIKDLQTSEEILALLACDKVWKRVAVFDSSKGVAPVSVS